jgi:7-carboxy-7-deazaguanine synthase
VFGTNKIVGKAAFRGYAHNTLKVTSVFVTLQGEGPLGGIPVVFVRFSHCNLSCSFCDTMFEQGDVLDFNQLDTKIYEAVCSYFNDKGMSVPLWAMPSYRVMSEAQSRFGPYGFALVITGGEPLLQNNLSTFLSDRMHQFSQIQIESNGTVAQDIPKGVILVCSPKCIEVEGKPVKYLKPTKTILERANCLKFVMSADQNSPYSQVPDWALTKAREGLPVYVSPMNVYKQIPAKIRVLRAKNTEVTMQERSTVDETVSFWEDGLLDMKANQENHEYAAQYCLTHGLRMNLQMHLYCSLA